MKRNNHYSNMKVLEVKRKKTNIATLGMGVLNGLHTRRVNSNSLCVTAGLAIDNKGREIAILKDRIVNIASIEGYDSLRLDRDVYLCLKYDDKDIARNNIKYKLILVQANIDEINTKYGQFLYNIDTIYKDNQVEVVNIIPKYLSTQNMTKGRIVIYKNNSLQRVQMEAILNLDGVYGEKDSDQIRVTEVKETTNKLDITYNIKSDSIPDKVATISIEHMKICIDDVEIDIDSKAVSKIKIIDEDIKQQYIKKFHAMPIEKINASMGDSIYLARLRINDVKGMYDIVKVKSMPFNQYIYNRPLIDEIANINIDAIEDQKRPMTTKTNVTALTEFEEPRVNVKYNEEQNSFNFNFGIPTLNKDVNTSKCDMTSGVTEVKIGKNAKANRCYYSDLINHGLGEGIVCITLAVEDTYKNLSNSMANQEDDQLIFGDLEVFAESDYVTQIPPVSLGSILYRKKGEFRVGVKLKTDTKLSKIPIRWWAQKLQTAVSDTSEKQDDIKQTNEIKVEIEPKKIFINKGQEVRFNAAVDNTKNDKVTWRTLEDDGGLINQKGVYIAPDIRGVYKIEAISVADFTKTGTAIIVVK